MFAALAWAQLRWRLGPPGADLDASSATPSHQSRGTPGVATGAWPGVPNPARAACKMRRDAWGGLGGGIRR